MTVLISCHKHDHSSSIIEKDDKIIHLVIDSKFMSIYDDCMNSTDHDKILSNALERAFEDYFNYVLTFDQACKRKMASERIRTGLEKARARGAKLGNPRLDMSDARSKYSEKAARFRSQAAPIIKELSRKELSLRAIAHELNNRQIPTERGGKWHASSVRRVLLEQAVTRKDPEFRRAEEISAAASRQASSNPATDMMDKQKTTG